jgi:hypothetical protein
MGKWIFGLGLLLSLSVSHEAQFEESGTQFDVPVKSFAAHEKGYLSPDEVPTGRLTVVAMQVTGFDGDKGMKLESALRLLEEVVNSEEFKERVINFKNKKGLRAFASNLGLSNEDIYARFMEGRETLQQDTPNEMNFFLKLYNNPWSRVIGYTSASTNLININWKYFKGNSMNNVAANLAHEWVHKIGFGHKSASEHDSAPYAIGYIVGELVKARLSSGLY